MNEESQHRFTKIDADGAVLPREATEWEAVLDNTTGLMWPVKAVKVSNWKKADAAAKKCTAAGFSDYRLPTVEELFLLADRTRFNPSIDTDFFPDCQVDWFWSSTVDCESPGDLSWVVFFYGGYSFRSHRSLDGFVRAVRVGQ